MPMEKEIAALKEKLTEAEDRIKELEASKVGEDGYGGPPLSRGRAPSMYQVRLSLDRKLEFAETSSSVFLKAAKEVLRGGQGMSVPPFPVDVIVLKTIFHIWLHGWTPKET